jgi:hypothetical protein
VVGAVGVGIGLVVGFATEPMPRATSTGAVASASGERAPNALVQWPPIQVQYLLGWFDERLFLKRLICSCSSYILVFWNIRDWFPDPAVLRQF